MSLTGTQVKFFVSAVSSKKYVFLSKLFTHEKPRQRHRPRLVPRHAGPVKDRTTMGHAAVLVRGPESVFAGDRRPVLERVTIHSLVLERLDTEGPDVRPCYS